MIDKLLLNNKILANKPIVQKVRVKLISKQVHKIRKLKNIQEKTKDNKKIATKLLKITEVLAYLKKLTPNDILRHALLNETDPQKVITNGLSTAEEVAYALFFVHESIRSAVLNLTNVLQIGKLDDSWREQILEPSKRKKKQQRTERKQQFRQERKARKELTQKRNEWLEENAPSAAVANQNNNEEPPVDKTTKSIQHGIKEENSILTPVISKTSGNRLKKERIIKEKLKPIQSSSESEEESQPPQSQRAVDDFFITQTGDHYLSTAVIDRKQSEAPNDGLVRKERRSLQGNSQRRVGNKRRYPDTWKQNGYENNKKQFVSSKSEKKQFTKKHINDSEASGKVGAERLHPSWAAKQQQKGIKSFEGKKVVFDNNSENHSQSNGEANKTMEKSKEKNTNQDKLHPSWEAKQKSKPTIADFKGKKVVFDDE